MSSPWDLFDDDAPAGEGSSSTAISVESSATPPPPKPLALVSIPYTRSWTAVAKFLDNHLEPTLADVKMLSRRACGVISDMTNAVLISLEALDKIDSEVRKLWLEDRKKTTTKGKAAEKDKEKEESLEAQVDANLNALFSVATRIHDETMGYLQSHGQWPAVCFRESYVFSQLVRAVVHAHYGRMQEAMSCIDMALILGAPIEEVEELARMMELGVLAHNAAQTAINKKQQQIEQAKREKEGITADDTPKEQTVPNLPAVLGPTASFRLSETMKKSAEAILAGKTKEEGFVSTLIERVACPGYGADGEAGAGAGGKKKSGKGGKAAAAVPAAVEDPANAEHPLIKAIRSPTDPSGKPVSPADFRRIFQNNKKPVVLMGALKDWQALKKWRDLTFWIKNNGHRTVPIEIGQHLSGFWKEEPMLLSEFIKSYVAPSINEQWGKWVGIEGVDDAEAKAQPEGTEISLVSPARIAYLAQHSLFEQIPSLVEDFSAPDYCPGAADLVVNSWFGTAGTITRLHYDSYNNLFSNAMGYKYVRLYAPTETPKLYPLRKEEAGPARRETVAPDAEAGSSAPSPAAAAAAKKGAGGKGKGGSGAGSSEASADVTTGQGNISAFSVDRPDYEAHPLAKEAQYVETVVGPGDLLFIPAGWWHYIRGITPCFSINFWWQLGGGGKY
jgi:Cupin-like domain